MICLVALNVKQIASTPGFWQVVNTRADTSEDSERTASELSV